MVGADRPADALIQRCFIDLDPDYAGLDTARYHWLSAAGRDPSKPMGASGRA